MNVTQYYLDQLGKRGYHPDPAQERAVARLQQSYDEWVVYKSRRSNALKKMLVKPEPPKGVWMYGGVGRGKSFLMDCFYATVPVVRKTRLHFHEFMRAVHLDLQQLKGVENPLTEVARRIAKKYRLICFDEFHVSDIADAMILERLLKALWAEKIAFVMTSNYQPDGLYPSGLHRERLLPAIELIKQNLDVMEVDAGNDYRRRMLEQIKTYHTPLGVPANDALRHAFEDLAETPDEDPRMTIEAREIKALRKAGGIIWFDFKTLCGGPRSQNDYLELASQFHTVVLSDVPEMTPAMSSEARRFTWLVDVLYDHRVKLLISAEVEAEKLYTKGQLANEFHRTASRLIEMQSKEYIDAPRRAAAEAFSGAALPGAGH